MNEHEIDPKIAYQKTLNGILVTFLLCNAAILTAVGIGFWYTVKRIDETAHNLNSKIDMSYDNTAKVAAAAIEKMGNIGTNIEDSVRSDVKEAKEKGKELIWEYLKSKSKNQEKSDPQIGELETGTPAR